MIKKIILATLFIYYGWEAYAHFVNPETQDSNCLGWVCDEVACPDGYAIWVPEEQKFLPCDMWDQYTKLGNRSVLK